jgi:CDP-glucose 4,6-dehydratase
MIYGIVIKHLGKYGQINMNLDFWKDKKVLITGHTGFKGGWLSLWLSKLGASVSGFALPAEVISFYNVCKLEEKINSYYGTIEDKFFLSEVIEEIKPEIIFHLAAQAIVSNSYLDPVQTFKTNIIGTVNLLDIVKQNPYIKSVLVITSDKCYNNQQSSVHKETDELGGDDPYSASKACAEIVVDSYRKSFFMNSETSIATARAGNVIGGGDWAQERLIPDIVRSIINNKDIILRNPRGIRPWQYILDVLSGYMKLSERLTLDGKKYAQAWNFGPKDLPISAAELTDRFLATWNYEKGWIDGSNLRTYKESEVLKLDCTKAYEELEWQPEFSLKQAISETSAWYKAYKENFDMLEFTNHQITVYENWMRA